MAFKSAQGIRNEIELQVKSEIAAERPSLGERCADGIASFGGSWTFIGLFMIMLFTWMGVNIYELGHERFDPYPFILLNLVLSCIAAIQAPVILMSSNRASEIDRKRDLRDYKSNLRAERHLEELRKQVNEMEENFELWKNDLKDKLDV